MTLEQVTISVLLLGLLAVFALDRYRIELVALAGLTAGVLLGLVPLERSFSGLASPAVITVIEVLLIVQALHRSHLLDRLAGWLTPRLVSPRRAAFALCALGASLSTVMNNIGALALMLPVAFSLARSTGLDARSILMPLSFATLLGGLCTIVGTPANLIVSAALAAERGVGFGFLDFAPTGILVAIVGLVVTAYWAPRALGTAAGRTSAGQAAYGRRVVTEVIAATGEQLTVGGLARRLGGDVRAATRDGRRLFPLGTDTALRPGDLLLVAADEGFLRDAIAAGALAFARSSATGPGAAGVEAAVMPQSTLVGSRIATALALAERGIRVVAVTTQNPRVEGDMDQLRLGIGDILHLEGDRGALRDAVEDADLMELAPAALIEARPVSLVPIVVFAIGILVAGFGLAPPEIAFGAVVVVIAWCGALDLRAGLADLNWPIVLLLVAMLPLGEAVGSTGAAAALAAGLGTILPSSSPLAVTALTIGLAMLVTPFVNNATTAVILAPIGVELARSTGVSPAMVLMAVAIGSSADFLTPFGHHNNTLAYGLGRYSFRDFLKVGWPLSIATFVTGLFTCVAVWS